MMRGGCYPDRGVLINALASAGARRVETEGALTRCPNDPEHLNERTLLQDRLASRRAAETQARRRLDWWEASWL